MKKGKRFLSLLLIMASLVASSSAFAEDENVKPKRGTAKPTTIVIRMLEY